MQAVLMSNLYACVPEYRLDAEDAVREAPRPVPTRDRTPMVDPFWTRLTGYFFGSAS